MAKTSASPKEGFVFVRIRRMDLQWSTCGIGIMPPPERRGEEGILTLCAKLVPGQVVALPANHDLTRHMKCEIVRGPERDEFVRPWVFDSQEHAIMADPSRSQLSASQIADGLNLIAGAVHNRMTTHEQHGDEEPLPFEHGPSFPDENYSRSRNAHVRADRAHQQAQEQDDAAVPVRGRGRPARAG